MTMKKIIICLMFILLLVFTGCKTSNNNDNQNNKDDNKEELIAINKITILFDSDNLSNDMLIKEEGLSASLKELDEDSDETGTFKTFEITITKKDGYEIKSDAVIEWEKKNSEDASIVSKKINKDEVIITINITYELKDNVITDKDNSVITYEYTLTLTPKENYEFSSDIILTWQKDDLEECVISEKEETSSKIVITFKKEIYLLFKVEITLDTLNYTVESDSRYYSAEIVKPLDYLYIVTKITLELNISDDFVFIVNGKEISSDKYKIEVVDNKNVLTYKIDDPNWTPYY